MQEELGVTGRGHLFLDEMDISVFSRTGRLHFVTGLVNIQKVSHEILYEWPTLENFPWLLFLDFIVVHPATKHIPRPKICQYNFYYICL